MVLWKHDLQCQACMDIIHLENAMLGTGILFFCGQEHLDIYVQDADVTGSQIETTEIPVYLQSSVPPNAKIFKMDVG